MSSVNKAENEMTILIVDDNDVNLMILKTFMASYRCRTLLAKDGRKALQHFTNNHVDLVLMDVMMPEMDGFEATKRIRKFEREHRSGGTPIIAVTAHIQPADRYLCINAGMNDYIEKPIKPEKMVDILRLWRPDLQFVRAKPAQAAEQPNSAAAISANNSSQKTISAARSHR